MFGKVESLKELEAPVEKFLANLEALKQKQIDRKISRQRQGEFFERAAEPITKATKDGAKSDSKAVTEELETIN